MTEIEILEWRKERDAVLMTFDVEKFRKFYAKWTEKGLYGVPLPDSDVVILMSMCKGILMMANPPKRAEVRARITLEALRAKDGK